MNSSTPLRELFTNMSDAFIGTVRDMYNPRRNTPASVVRQRRLYLALLVILLVLVGNLFFVNM